MSRVLDKWLAEGFHPVRGTDGLWHVSVFSVRWLAGRRAERLARASVMTLADLWLGSTVIISNRTRYKPETILRWQQFADLMRVEGVGQETARLLYAAGVGTVRQLAKSEPAGLRRAIEEALKQSPQLAKRKPGLKVIEGWIKDALTIGA